MRRRRSSICSLARSSTWNGGISVVVGASALIASLPRSVAMALRRIYASIGPVCLIQWEEVVESVRGEHRRRSSRRRRCRPGRRRRTSRSPRARTRRSRSPAPRPAGGPRLLPGRLEPRLLRPDGALQGAAPGVPAARRRAARHLGRRRLVPPGLRQRPATCTSRCSPTSSPRARSRGPTASTARGRHERAGAVRDRRATASCAGATSLRSASTPAPTGSSRALEEPRTEDAVSTTSGRPS